MAATPWLHWLILALSGILNLVGLVGLLLVFFPGLTVAWVGQLIWFIFVGFNKSHGGWQFGLTIAIFVINTIIMLVGSVVDNILGATETAKKRRSLVGNRTSNAGHGRGRNLPDANWRHGCFLGHTFPN